MYLGILYLECRYYRGPAYLYLFPSHKQTVVAHNYNYFKLKNTSNHLCLCVTITLVLLCSMNHSVNPR